jgi:hypothetical protein
MELGFIVVYVSTMAKNNIVLFESVDGINDKLACDASKNPTTNTKNVESIHL